MQMDQQALRELLEFLSSSDIQELKLEGDDFRLEVRRNMPAPAAVMVSAPAAAAPLPAAPVMPEVVAAAAPPPAAAASRGDLVEVKAPMVGTFYRAPAPGEAPFVEVGSKVSNGQTICILEAMKLMNELESELSGEVVEILVENGTPVEYNQVLMLLRPS
ncbi:MAG: acetyl-CoA carboxylase biotin carboxyl carrier protein [Synechococcus sp.]|nr:acetyl-CoA carboxylase biotin carboxyl carrier protein [Synechococcus sp.]